MLKNRFLSFLFIGLIYVVAIAGGWFLFQKLPFDYRISLLICDIYSTIIVFIFSVAFSNASVYDPYWSVQPIVIMIFFAAHYGLNFLGILLMIAICWWGLRLTSNWAYTFKNLTCQDWRYTMLHEKTGKFYPVINFIGIHMVPTLVVYLCVLPAVVAVYEQAIFRPICAVFIAISILAALIQLIADIQMHTFRKAKADGKISGEDTAFIRKGLWKHARHPNYFGEITMWWGIGLACVFAMPENWFLIAGAVANTLLFSFVSIPMADKRQSKKPGFDEYKKQTRVLI